MGIFSRMKEILSNLFRQKARDEFKINTVTSPEMQRAIEKCAYIYKGSPYWLDKDEHIKTINFAKAVCSETARLATLAIGIEIDGSARANWLQEQIDKELEQYSQAACVDNTADLGSFTTGVQELLKFQEVCVVPDDSSELLVQYNTGENDTLVLFIGGRGLWQFVTAEQVEQITAQNMETAWNVARQGGYEDVSLLAVAPGNYGERFLSEHLGIAIDQAVTCSNFIADAIRWSADAGMSEILFVGHIGKLIKVAGGVKNTHSKYGDGRMEQMAVLTRELGHPELQEWVRACNTTDDALALLKEQGLAKPLLCRTARYVKNWIETWSGGRITAEAVTFSTAHQLLGATENWQKLFDAWQETSGQSNL